MIGWAPQPGPQAFAATCPLDIIFYGGTRGGGKSDCLLGRHIRGAEKYKHHWNGLILRRKFKDFAELRRRIDELIRDGLPAERVGGDQQTNYIRFDTGAVVTMTAVMRLEMVDSFHGHQYTEISIDEAPNFPFIYQMIDKLKGSLRSPHGVPCSMFLTGNPGGPGASMIKIMFIEPGEGKLITDPDTGEKQIFIKSTLRDNKILWEKDPKYVARLMSIKDPNLRAAWLEGDWDVFVGQAFYFTREHHVIKPIWPIPEWAKIYMTFDWGFGAPFSVGWWWVDQDGRAYRFNEWYGWDGKTPNVGLRYSDPKIADGIKQREKEMKINSRDVVRLSGPDCFNKKPDYKGGGQGPATSEEFSLKGLYLTAADVKRELKWRQFQKRLEVPEDSSMPMLVVYETCKDFIRIIPSLCVDESNPEDIDTEQEDHPYDEACHICMARPLSLEPPGKRTLTDKRIDMLTKRGGDYDGSEETRLIATMREEGALWAEDDALNEIFGTDYDLGLDLPYDREVYDL